MEARDHNHIAGGIVEEGQGTDPANPFRTLWGEHKRHPVQFIPVLTSHCAESGFVAEYGIRVIDFFIQIFPVSNGIE